MNVLMFEWYFELAVFGIACIGPGCIMWYIHTQNGEFTRSKKTFSMAFNMPILTVTTHCSSLTESLRETVEPKTFKTSISKLIDSESTIKI